ncbi:type II secretion system protein GspL [Alteromonas sp. C1M14]|uniref:type II secretion system protein GspL n=1 Tax=Alteromonas sp. C1M14 TaxID=2841567 RepID=UPI001C09DBAD|nr:type II secretion system protein GspL [Alteromonas sp. C1M14]MBU2978323.1 type II secretion system protein GspL [Alteromonas sp. C1M14]
MEQLLVRLGSRHDAPVQWLVWSASEREIIASGELPDAAHLASLKERAGQRPVIALAPGSDILLKWVNLPPRAGRKILSALPFMLEDELAEDINQQFFAIGPKRGDKQAVAVVSHEKMNNWQQWLKDAGLLCDRLIPDVLAVPLTQNGWSVLTLGEDILLREDEWQGMQGEASWVLPAFTHILRQQDAQVVVRNYSDHDLSALPNATVEQEQLELPMHVLAMEASRADFNLLQGEYRAKRKRAGQWYQWRVAAVLAVIALTTSLIDKGVTLYQLKQANAKLSQNIDNVVKAGFPNLGTYRDVKLKIRSEMAKLEQGGGGSSLLVMMEQLTPAFSTSQIKPQTIRFDSVRTELRMQAQGKSFESLEQFRRQAEGAGFEVEQGAINNRDDMVIGTVSIRG